ncbi:MAG: hypothetical protein HYU36_22870 [Planctomycetes bacterium]|nr:hypothetical protein [Planctomycetota bacterium]
MADEKPCPKCGRRYPPGVVICVPCGINLVTGEELRTQVPDLEKAEERNGEECSESDASGESEEQPQPLSPPMRVLECIGSALPGLFRPVVLLAAFVLLVVSAGLMGLGAVVIAFGAILSGISIAAMGLLAYAQAAVCLITGEIWLIHDALAEFESRAWTLLVFFLALPFIAAFVLYRLGIVLVQS